MAIEINYRHMKKHILITGGTGLIGQRLSMLLQEKGHTVAHLSRKKSGTEAYPTFQWNIEQQTIDSEAIENASHIVHLAGASIAGKKWTESYKEVILKSRTESTHLLYQKLQQLNHQVKAFVAASGANYYGMDTGSQLMTEESASGSEFLPYVVREWENAVSRIEKLGIRRVQLRTGMVLSEKDGALPKMMIPIKLGLGAPLGSGDQYMSWIHIDDLCRIYIKALEDESMHGIYNAVSPEPVTNTTFTKKVANQLNRPVFLPKVPGGIIKVALGEMANLLLGGIKVSSKKIENTGFNFQYATLDQALQDLLSK